MSYRKCSVSSGAGPESPESPAPAVLNRPSSSREHAPWALYDHGFRAIVSTSIADIFKSNALKNGLLPIVVDRGVHAKLLGASGTVVTVSLEEQTLALADGTTIAFPIDPFGRLCLMNGHDELDFLLSQRPAVARFEATPR